MPTPEDSLSAEKFGAGADDDDDDIDMPALEKACGKFLRSDSKGAVSTVRWMPSELAGTAAGGLAQGSQGAVSVVNGAHSAIKFVPALGAIGGIGASVATIATISTPVGWAMSAVESGFSAYSCVNTLRHIKALEKIVEEGHTTAMDGTIKAILYICVQKNRKAVRKGVGAVPVAGSILNLAFSAGRSLQKRIQGTKGVQRREQSAILWSNVRAGDKVAIAACKELLGDKIYNSIAECNDGYLVLEKKMASF